MVDIQALTGYATFFMILVGVGLAILFFFSKVQKQALDNYKELAKSLEEQKTNLQGQIEELKGQMNAQSAEIESLKRENAAMVGYTELSKMMVKNMAHVDIRFDELKALVVGEK